VFLSAPGDEVGVVRWETKRRFLHAGSSKNACYARELALIPSCRSKNRQDPAVAGPRASAKAENKALENGLPRALYSGCHCTPTTNRASGKLTASICPSGATASTRSLGAGQSIPWVCSELTITSVAPARDVRSPPAVKLTRWAGPYGPSGESLRER